MGLVEPLARPDAAWVATEPEKRLGCLMVNTSSEVSPHIRSVARVVSSYLGDLRALLRRACVKARTRGEIRSDTDVDRAADYLVGATLGLWTLARSPAPPAVLRHYVDGVLGFVDGLRPEARRPRP